MITFKEKGDFKNLNNFFEKAKETIKQGTLDNYGRRGVEALASATPKDTGLASQSWQYSINRSKGSVSIEWFNTDIEDGYNVAILLQYGHATKNGKFVKGIDYINPAIKPIFEELAEEAWKEVTHV